MSTNDVSVTALGLNKRPVSHKHQVHSHSPTTGKSRADEFRVNRTMTAMNRPLSKLPNGRVKTSFYSSTLGKLFIEFFFLHKNQSYSKVFVHKKKIRLLHYLQKLIDNRQLLMLKYVYQ
jgi:hypothetical protein